MMRNEFHVSAAMPQMQEPDEVSADEDSGEDGSFRIAERMRVLREGFLGQVKHHPERLKTSYIESSIN